MRYTTCDDCGQGVEVDSDFGPLPKRCPPCKADHEQKRRQAAKAREREKRRSTPRDIRCADCGAQLEWSGQGRPKERCDPCRREHNRKMNSRRSLAWIRANPERARELQRKGYQRNVEAVRARKLEQHYRRKYGISSAERDRMHAEQGGQCAICGGEPKGRGDFLHIDHCHETDRVRGLLCMNCNTAIGLMDEDPERFAAAAEYLRRS